MRRLHRAVFSALRIFMRAEFFLDRDFPTIIRLVGIVLIFYSVIVDKGRNPALIPAATGLILFRTVYRNGEKD